MKTQFLKLTALLLILVSSIASCEDGKEGQKYDIYENHDISACGVDDPLQNIEWLREYSKSLDVQDFSGINIDLYKKIDTDEHIFQIYLTYPLEDMPMFGPVGFEKDWRDCTGKIIIRVLYPGTPMPPESQERLNEFLESIEFVAELFHFVKQ